MASYYYNTSEWKQLRQACLKRDNYTCQKCGKTGKEYTGFRDKNKLIAHHIMERKNGGKDELKNLETLCQNCHRLTDHFYPESFSIKG